MNDIVKAFREMCRIIPPRARLSEGTQSAFVIANIAIRTRNSVYIETFHYRDCCMQREVNSGAASSSTYSAFFLFATFLAATLATLLGAELGSISAVGSSVATACSMTFLRLARLAFTGGAT